MTLVHFVVNELNHLKEVMHKNQLIKYVMSSIFVWEIYRIIVEKIRIGKFSKDYAGRCF